VRAAILGWRYVDQQSAGLQLLRAVESIGANIAEATSRWTYKEQLRFFIMARGSLHETQQWLEKASARGLHLPMDAQSEADEIGRMLNGLIKSTARRTAARS
jgi:four helix bundle protein